jgi:hypothetical protein
MNQESELIAASLIASTGQSKQLDNPYRHWLLADCFPSATLDAVLDLPFEAPNLEGVSGKRELHNATRTYFDQGHRQEFPVCEAVSQAFFGQALVSHFSSFFSINLADTYLRIEFAQDIDGFWLQPHTDLGVKLFTMLLYLSTDPTHVDLGTDIYDEQQNWVSRSPFYSNNALVFIPSENTYHGFEARPIRGVRKSLIINYVTEEWRAREQLAFSDPIL